MNTGEKLKFFAKELDDRIKDFAHKRNRDKNRAFGLKLLAVFFAAAITVLLGLKVAEPWAEIFRNLALGLWAIITVVNAVDAFYDHRSLWIRRTVTLAHLYALQADLKFYVAGLEEPEIDMNSLERFRNRYERILRDDLKAWLKLREESAPPSEAQAATATEGS